MCGDKIHHVCCDYGQFLKNIDTLKIHIIINFVSKVFKNTSYWYKISEKNKKITAYTN